MKALKILTGIMVVLAIIIVVVSFFLPKTYFVNRSILISAPDSVIYRNIADYNEFYKWNSWSKMDTAAAIKITGEIAKPGHLYQWDGKKNGKGQMKITHVEPNKMIDMELKFIDPMESIADTRFDIIPAEQSNKVTWTMSGKSEGIVSKWMGLMMDKMVGKDFEDGLKSLKKKSEGRN